MAYRLGLLRKKPSIIKHSEGPVFRYVRSSERLALKLSLFLEAANGGIRVLPRRSGRREKVRVRSSYRAQIRFGRSVQARWNYEDGPGFRTNPGIPICTLDLRLVYVSNPNTFLF